MRLPVTALVAFTLIILTSAAQAETRLFGDWQVSCNTFDECTASASFNANPGDNLPAEQILHIDRQPYETYWEISLTSFVASPANAKNIYVTIDNDTTIFAASSDFAAFDTLNRFYLLGTKAQTIMDQMMPGTSVSINFADDNGDTQKSSFSLTGLTAALLWIDEQQKRVGSERVAEAPPANKTRVTVRSPAPLSDELLARHAANTNCDSLQDLVHGEDIFSYRMSATDTLHMIPCWSGAYNFSYVVYVEGQYGTEQSYFASYSETLGWSGTATLVNPWFDERTNVLRDFYKGRGLGDCGTSGLWQWNGYAFKLLQYEAKDACDTQDNPGEFPVIYRAKDYQPYSNN